MCLCPLSTRSRSLHRSWTLLAARGPSSQGQMDGVVSGEYTARPVDPHGRAHRQPRAVDKYWARMRLWYSVPAIGSRPALIVSVCSAMFGPQCYMVCVSLRFWCSCSLPCASVCGYVCVGKDCACLSVVLVLVFIAVRVGVRILPHGQGLLALRGSGARVYVRCDVVWW